MTKVWITYPHAHTVSHNFLHSLTGHVLRHRDLIAEISGVRCNPGDGLIQGRNQAMRDFLASDAEWLWTLDTDMGFPHDALPRLLAHDKPVVSALYRTVWEEATDSMGGMVWSVKPVAMREVEGGYQTLREYKGVMEVDAVGAGCLLVSRAAAEAVRDKFGEEWFSIVRPWGDGRTLGEDFSFCWRLGQCGIPITLDATLPVTHHKGVWV